MHYRQAEDNISILQQDKTYLLALTLMPKIKQLINQSINKPTNQNTHNITGP